MYWPWPDKDPYRFLGQKVKGQGQIRTLTLYNFLPFLLDNFISFWHTMMI